MPRRVIYDPNNPEAYPNYGSTPSGGGTQTQGGGEMDMLSTLKQIYAMNILKGAKKTSDVVAAFQMMEPSASQVKREDEKKKLDEEKQNKLNQINEAINLLNKKKLNTGLIAGPLLAIKARAGWVSKDESKLYRLIGKIGAEEMFKIGGKVLPAQEIKRLEPFIPIINMSKGQNLTNLEEMKKEIENVYKDYESGKISFDSGTTDTTGEYEYSLPSSWQDEEQEEY